MLLSTRWKRTLRGRDASQGPPRTGASISLTDSKSKKPTRGRPDGTVAVALLSLHDFDGLSRLGARPGRFANRWPSKRSSAWVDLHSPPNR